MPLESDSFITGCTGLLGFFKSVFCNGEGFFDGEVCIREIGESLLVDKRASVHYTCEENEQLPLESALNAAGG